MSTEKQVVVDLDIKVWVRLLRQNCVLSQNGSWPRTRSRHLLM